MTASGLDAADQRDLDAEVYGPQFPTLEDLGRAQEAPCAANLAGCTDVEYDRLVLERQQTEAAYLEGYDRDLAAALEAGGGGDAAPAATAADVAAVLTGGITGADADAVLASYFAPGPHPRYDTPQARAEAEAAEPEAEMEPEL